MFYTHIFCFTFCIYLQAENKSLSLLREKAELQSRAEETEDDLSDVMRKYKAVVQQVHIKSIRNTV